MVSTDPPLRVSAGTVAADVRVRRLADFADAELFTRRFANFRFRRHAHERLIVAAITRGRQRVSRPDGHVDVGPGTLITFNPDLVHWGGAVEADGWDTRQFHVDHAMLVELAGAAGISRCHLVREFTKAVCMPPHAWLVHRRVRESERLLRRGRPPVETAIACGFADQAHLTRAFKAANGFTPARFRAAMR